MKRRLPIAQLFLGTLLLGFLPHVARANEPDANAKKICKKLSADDCCNAAWNFFHGKNGVEQDRAAATALFKESCRIYKNAKRGETAPMCCSMVPK